MEEQEHISRPAGHIPPNVPQDTIGPSGCKGTASSWSTCHSLAFPGPSLQSCSVGYPPARAGTWGYSPARCWTLHLLLLILIRFLSAEVSDNQGPAEWQHSHQDYQHCPGFILSANLLSVHSTPLSSSLICKLNKTGPIIEPWGMPQRTDLQLDSTPLIMTL